MKATQRIQRRSTSSTGPSISLFPFLAVLICTMGVLVPLLLAITRTARLQAEATAQAKAAEQTVELQTQHEDVVWRIAQLKKSRTKTDAQLADARLQLGHIEDHARRLREKLSQYKTTIADLERVDSADQQQLIQSQAELEQVRAQVGTTQQQLAQSRQAAAGRKRCYSVVPYEGPNQTHRRPIYLECHADAVILRPEGIELTESDFEGPLGPGNPLAMALRAAREYLLSQRDVDPQAGEPYPLLLVPPEGISAYYAARAAMKSWGFEFGYELVDDGWKIAYPPADPRLADLYRQVVTSARASQARLVAAAPRQYGNQPKAVYRVVPSGGLVREGGSSDDDDRGYVSTSPAGPIGRAKGTSGRGNNGSAAGSGQPGYPGGSGDGGGSGGSDAAPANPYLAVGNNQGRGFVGNPYASVTGNPSGGSGGSEAGAGPMLGGNGADNGGYPQGVGGLGGAAAPANPYAAGSQGTGTVASGSGPTNSGAAPAQGTAANRAAPQSCPSASNSSSKGDATEPPEGYVAGQPPREQAASNPSPDSASAANGRILRPGEWEPTPDLPPVKPKHDDGLDEKHGKHAKSLAQQHGTDWGLRDSTRGSVGVTRPIRIDCYADRLVVVSERGPANDKVIPLGPRTRSSIDPLISVVWEHMESWGIAGRSMYWRPLLQMHVAPEAEQRYAELSALLEGSGLVVERK